MRFYFGFSKRIPFKIVIAGLIALATLLIGVLGVHADTTGVPSLIQYESGNILTATVNDAGSYFYFNISNMGMNAKNFVFTFPVVSNACDSNLANFSFTFDFIDENNLYAEHLGISDMKYSNNKSISGTLTGTDVKTLSIQNLDLTKSFSFMVNEVYLSKLLRGEFRAASYECVRDTTSEIINNQDSNTQDIINNQTQNTQDIIDNQNANNQALIDSNKVCSLYDSSSIILDNSYFSSNGNINSNSSYGITDYIKIYDADISFNTYMYHFMAHSCYYDINKNLISCSTDESLSSSSIPSNAYYLRLSIEKSRNLPTAQVCINGSQAIADSQQQINDSLTDDNIGGSLSTGNSFFDNFSVDDSRGFTSIITAPIRLLQTIINSGSSCSDLTIPLNMSDGVFSGSNTLTLPCGQILWSKAPSAIQLLWHTLVYGLLGYRVLVDMVRFINHMLNPEYSTEYLMDL